MVALRTDPFEDDIVSSKFESVGILNGFLQIRFIFHVNVEYVTALHTFCMVVITANVIKAISSARELSFSNFARFG